MKKSVALIMACLLLITISVTFVKAGGYYNVEVVPNSWAEYVVITSEYAWLNSTWIYTNDKIVFYVVWLVGNYTDYNTNDNSEVQGINFEFQLNGDFVCGRWSWIQFSSTEGSYPIEPFKPNSIEFWQKYTNNVKVTIQSDVVKVNVIQHITPPIGQGHEQYNRIELIYNLATGILKSFSFYAETDSNGVGDWLYFSMQLTRLYIPEPLPPENGNSVSPEIIVGVVVIVIVFLVICGIAGREKKVKNRRYARISEK